MFFAQSLGIFTGFFVQSAENEIYKNLIIYGRFVHICGRHLGGSRVRAPPKSRDIL